MQVHERTMTESLEVKSGELIDTVKQVIHEGNVRRITIKQDGEVIAEFPLTFGVVGAVIAPALAAIGAIAALVSHCTIEVERSDPPASQVGSD
jgi:Domain of unknown function (DUF4342)